MVDIDLVYKVNFQWKGKDLPELHILLEGNHSFLVSYLVIEGKARICLNWVGYSKKIQLPLCFT